MGCIYNVEKTCLRYVVPFRYEESFEEAMIRVESRTESGQRLWRRKVVGAEDGESDLYEYVRNEFCFDNDNEALSEQKCGCEWSYGQSGNVKELWYIPNRIRKNQTEYADKWDMIISNVGLLLFRNGLGFVWYELTMPENTVNSDQLMQFQNNAKEFCHYRKKYFMEKPEENLFFFGKWLNEMIRFLKVRYLADRDGMPDKAILYTYATLTSQEENDTPEDRDALTYHLTNGYTDSYHFSDETAADIKRPFGNAYWYATQEGAAYLAWPGKDNEQVFSENILNKIKTDYFTLYLKTLYQSFSLMLYAEKIQTQISAVKEKYLGESVDERITTLFGEINLFLTKSMATSVSHIHHQSEFYIYLKKQLRVHEDVKSVTAGLNALDMLQRGQHEAREKERDSKLQAIMGLFALLGISSALSDCFGFWDAVGNLGNSFIVIIILKIMCAAVIGLISAGAVAFAGQAFCTAFKDSDSRITRILFKIFWKLQAK